MSTNLSTELLLKAVNFTAQKHTDQKRKNNKESPYINHPIEVSYILSTCGITDVVVLCAAVLHDTVEDTTTSYTELVENFGKKIADVVIECSDS